jgi:hypothetical protein
VHQDRRRGKGSRLLYWFRTPPGVKVGRAALDEDAIRLLEELHPDVEFDWTRMLKAEPAQEVRPSSQGPYKGPPSQKRHGAGPRPAVSMNERATPERARHERATERRASPRPPVEPLAIPVEPAIEREESISTRDISVVEGEAPEAIGAEAPAAEDVVAFPVREMDIGGEAPSLMPSAAQARLGTEGIVRLRGRYAEVLARIAERIPDPARREELKAQAERLNPDSWVTDDEVRAGLEQYETAFESLRAVVGRRGKRRRRRGARPQSERAVTGTEAEDAGGPPDSDDPADG